MVNPIESGEKTFIERSNFKAELARRRPINRNWDKNSALVIDIIIKPILFIIIIIINISITIKDQCNNVH